MYPFTPLLFLPGRGRASLPVFILYCHLLVILETLGSFEADPSLWGLRVGSKRLQSRVHSLGYRYTNILGNISFSWLEQPSSMQSGRWSCNIPIPTVSSNFFPDVGGHWAEIQVRKILTIFLLSQRTADPSFCFFFVMIPCGDMGWWGDYCLVQVYIEQFETVRLR